MDFDRQHSFVLGGFFLPGKGPTADSVPTAFSKEPKGAPKFSIRLRHRTDQQMMRVVPGSASQLVAATQWTGPEIWRASLSDDRVDITVDALGYRDIADKTISAQEFVDRTLPGLKTLAADGVAFYRPLLNVTGTMSSSACPNPSEVVRRRILRSDLNGNLADVLIRTNLPTGTAVAEGLVVNRLETMESRLNFAGPVESKAAEWTFTWQADVNTSLHHFHIYSPDDLETFFTEALAWICELENEIEKCLSTP